MSLRPEPNQNIIGERPASKSTFHPVELSSSVVRPSEQEYHIVGLSDLELKLMKNERRTHKRDFTSPIGLLVTIGLTFGTAQFHKTGGIAADVWAGFYASIGLLALYRLVTAIVSYHKDPPMECDKLAKHCLDIEDVK